jgi:hypothetical protein
MQKKYIVRLTDEERLELQLVVRRLRQGLLLFPGFRRVSSKKSWPNAIGIGSLQAAAMDRKPLNRLRMRVHCWAQSAV